MGFLFARAFFFLSVRVKICLALADMLGLFEVRMQEGRGKRG